MKLLSPYNLLKSKRFIRVNPSLSLVRHPIYIKEVKWRIKKYVSHKIQQRQSPSIEQIRKSIYGPSCGWSKTSLRKFAIEIGYEISNKDKIKIKAY